MQNFLQKIVDCTLQTVDSAQRQIPLAQLKEVASDRHDFRSLAKQLSVGGVRIIAEIKRASPSLGAIRIDLDPAALAKAYQAGGAAAISVLTEPAFFKGSIADLQAARNATELPVLRKDFILTPYQVYESVVIGADAILLIVRILDDDTLKELYTFAKSLSLEVLVEVYDQQDVARARKLDAKIIGINNRDLSAFNTNTSNAVRLAQHFDSDVFVVAASGIHTPADVKNNLNAGINCFLIGESLVRANDPATLLQQFVNAHEEQK